MKLATETAQFSNNSNLTRRPNLSAVPAELSAHCQVIARLLNQTITTCISMKIKMFDNVPQHVTEPDNVRMPGGILDSLVHVVRETPANMDACMKIP